MKPQYNTNLCFPTYLEIKELREISDEALAEFLILNTLEATTVRRTEDKSH